MKAIVYLTASPSFLDNSISRCNAVDFVVFGRVKDDWLENKSIWKGTAEHLKTLVVEVETRYYSSLDY